MARAETVADTRAQIIEAARSRLLDVGHAALSTRKVAEAAKVPLSQLHYHFGSKQGLLLAVLEDENRRRLDRQTAMYASDHPLWQRYEQACDYLEDDLDSGFVRILQEMIATGWADERIGEAVRSLLRGWFELLTDVAAEAESRHGPLGPFTHQETGTLIGLLFMGAESMILLGFDRHDLPVRSALRRVGLLIRHMEEHGATQGGNSAGTAT